MPRKKKLPSRKGKKRYSEKRKQALLEKYSQLRSEGHNAQDAAKTIGVPYITLHTWEKKAGRTKARQGRVKKPARAIGRARGRGRPSGSRATKSKKGNLTLVTPAGFKIEGITPKELIQVLNQLK